MVQTSSVAWWRPEHSPYFLLELYLQSGAGRRGWVSGRLNDLQHSPAISYKNAFYSACGFLSGGSIYLCLGLGLSAPDRGILTSHSVLWEACRGITRHWQGTLEGRRAQEIRRRWWVCALSKITAPARSNVVTVNPWALLGRSTIGTVTVPELMRHFP